MSGIISSIAVALTVLLAAPLAANLPVAALSGVLLVVAVEMIRVKDIRRTVLATETILRRWSSPSCRPFF